MISDKNSKLLLIVSLIISIALFHYGTPHHLMNVHILLQSLFFIPVYLAGTWFGKKGAAIASLGVAAVYVHHAVTVMMPTSEMAVGNSIQVLMLFVVGLLVGAYADFKRSYQRTVFGLKETTPSAFSEDQALLIYVDDSGAAMNAVRYVANMFGHAPDVKVTLLNILSGANPDFFETKEELINEQERSFESSRTAVERAHQMLLDGGFAEANIHVRFAHSQGARISDVIIHEQRSGNYGAIVVGRHQLSRAEEFLFGSVAVRLARQATCPVWVIGENPAAEPMCAPAANWEQSDNMATERDARARNSRRPQYYIYLHK